MGPKKKNSNLQMHTPTFCRTTMAYSHPKFQPCKMTVTCADLTTKFLIIDFLYSSLIFHSITVQLYFY